MKGVFYLLTACMAVSVLCSCNGKKEAQEDVQYVMTATAKGGGNESQQTYPARTRSMEETNVAFRVSGTIERVFVKEGDYVRKGQLIATMDARDYRVQLEATQAEYAQIKADAEAYYNSKIAASLSQYIVQEDWIEKWDGHLPTVASGSGMILDLKDLKK